MRVVNRCAVVVTPKQPFLNWLHRIDPSSHDIKMGDLRRDPSVYLFPECNDDRGLTKLLKKGCLEIFEKELESWDRIEESWPKDRSFAAFRRWFDYSIHWDGLRYHTSARWNRRQSNNYLCPLRGFGHNAMALAPVSSVTI
jgi:hypothetical protein